MQELEKLIKTLQLSADVFEALAPPGSHSFDYERLADAFAENAQVPLAEEY